MTSTKGNNTLMPELLKLVTSNGARPQKDRPLIRRKIGHPVEKCQDAPQTVFGEG
jgi:hypothetical protein